MDYWNITIDLSEKNESDLFLGKPTELSFLNVFVYISPQKHNKKEDRFNTSDAMFC